MSFRHRTLPLEPAGDHRWILAPGWLCEENPAGGWAALPPEDNMPPLFAPTLQSLVWVVTSWENHLRRRISFSVAAAVRKARTQQEPAAGADDCITEPANDELLTMPVCTDVPSPAMTATADDWDAPMTPAQRILARRREAREFLHQLQAA